MTEAEKNEIVGLVMTQISSQAVDFDIETEQPQANDLLTAVRKIPSGEYLGVTLKWDDVARIATELANQAATRAEQAETDANNILERVQSKGTEITNFVATSKAEIETQKDESVNAVKSVYQTDLNELKGDLDTLAIIHQGNIFNKAILISDNAYIYGQKGSVYNTSSNSSFSSYLLPVDGVSTYSFTMARFAMLIDADMRTIISDVVENTEKIDSTGAKYIGFSFNHDLYPVDNFCVSRGDKIVIEKNVEWTDFSGIPSIENVLKSIGNVEYNNLFNNGELLSDQGYYYNSNGVLGYQESSEYSAYIFKLNKNTVYSCTYGRFVCLVNADKQTVNGYYQFVTQFTTNENTEYVIISFNHGDYPIEKYVLCEGEILKKDKLVLTDIAKESIKNATGQHYPYHFVSRLESMAESDVITFPAVNVKKNNIYSFVAKVSDFSNATLKIGHGENTYSSSFITVDNANVRVTNYLTSEETQIFAHGLSIADFIHVTITVGICKAKVYIRTSSGDFEKTDVTWYGDSQTGAFAKISNGSLSKVTFSWASDDITKDVWCFGDSYFSMTSPQRWVYHLLNDGYTNILLNSFAGETTYDNLIALNNLIKIGCPKIIVWCVGMNDGSDTDDSPSSRWMDGVNNVIGICEENNIIPIFATIPTVPNINHRKKCEWVKNSGYRYIDFESAVGADVNENWYNGMLAGDKVHPTESGAKALYRQAICDCPELTFTN